MLFKKVLRGVERQCMVTYGRGAVVDFFRARATLALEVVGVSSAPWKMRGLLGSDNKDAKKTQTQELLRNSSSKQQSNIQTHGTFFTADLLKTCVALEQFMGTSPSDNGRRPNTTQIP